VKLLTVEGVDLWRELGLVYPPATAASLAPAQALIGMIREHRKVGRLRRRPPPS